MYQHSMLWINYTIYDLQREQDTINPLTRGSLPQRRANPSVLVRTRHSYISCDAATLWWSNHAIFYTHTHECVIHALVLLRCLISIRVGREAPSQTPIFQPGEPFWRFWLSGPQVSHAWGAFYPCLWILSHVRVTRWWIMCMSVTRGRWRPKCRLEILLYEYVSVVLLPIVCPDNGLFSGSLTMTCSWGCEGAVLDIR